MRYKQTKSHFCDELLLHLSHFCDELIISIEVGGKSKDGKQIAREQSAFIAADNIDYPVGNKIPLWAFGLLY